LFLISIILNVCPTIIRKNPTKFRISKIFISNTMIFWKLVIKCPRKPREVCGIPEGEARGNSTNLPRVRDI
jgi:hypothetical protein